MIEYLLNAIRAVAGQEITIAAKITDEAGAEIVDGCAFVLHLDNDTMAKIEGVYVSALNCWQFTIPAEITKGYIGRYEYCIQHKGNNLCFKEPFYLI
jgi:hypothetical protein